MKHSLLKKGILGFIFTLILVSAVVVPTSTLQAQPEPRTYTLLEPLPCSGSENCENNMVTEVDLLRYINVAYKIAIGLAGVLAVFMIVVGGFQYITTDAVFEKKEGKEKIQRAIQGLILTIFSYFILYIIDPRLVQIDSSTIKLESVETTGEIFDIENFIRGIEDDASVRQKAIEETLELKKSANEKREQAKNTTNVDEKNKLLVEANELEKQAVIKESATLADTYLQRTINTIDSQADSIKSALGLFSPAIATWDHFFGNNADIKENRQIMKDEYLKTIDTLERKGDIAQANYYKDKLVYAESTIDATIILSKALSTSDITENKKYRDELFKFDANHMFKIKDPSLRSQYEAEATKRIAEIDKKNLEQ